MLAINYIYTSGGSNNSKMFYIITRLQKEPSCQYTNQSNDLNYQFLTFLKIVYGVKKKSCKPNSYM